MNFSWNYCDTMDRLICPSNIRSFFASEDARKVGGYCSMIKFDLNAARCEVPTIVAGSAIVRLVPTTEEETVTVVLPMYYDIYPRQYSGAETIIKYFTRVGGRLAKVITPKGEVYYGNHGIILDKDFNPLLFSTKIMHWDFGQMCMITDQSVIHLSPLVFTDDEKMLNKSLGKKGIAYYLTKRADSWSGSDVTHKVVIDDCSEFIIKPNKPKVSNCSNEDFNNILKDNIDEILRQIANDNRADF